MSDSELVEYVTEGKFSELIKGLQYYGERISGVKDQQGNTLVHLASSNDRVEILDHLLKYVINI